MHKKAGNTSQSLLNGIGPIIFYLNWPKKNIIKSISKNNEINAAIMYDWYYSCKFQK